MFNKIYKTGEYPKAWSSSYITPLHKKRKKGDPLNYRGIAISSSMGKLFNSKLDSRLEEFMKESGIEHKYQNALKKDARTTENLFAFIV